MTASKIATTVLRLSSPIGWMVAEGAERAAKALDTASENGLEQLKSEAAKQSLRLQFLQQQARVDQEAAIAMRISEAVEVEIEEFYDASGKANLGVSVDPAANTGSIDLGGEGRRVTKRIYKFKGWRNKEADVVTQELGQAG